jgi:hypothetical protein
VSALLFFGAPCEHLLSRAETASGRLQRQVLALLEKKKEADEIPTSVRFLFYELEQAGVVSKRATNQDGSASARKPSQNLNDAVTHLRKAGVVPYDWIVDESRHVKAWRYAASVYDYLADSVDLAAIDRFPGVSRPVVITESRTVGGVLERGVCADYRVSVAPTGGQSLGFLVTKVAPYLKDVRTRVEYVGDHDDAGNDIEANTRRVLEQATGRTFTAETWQRVLLTDTQVRGLKRRGIQPVEKRDERYSDGNPHLAYEAEALGQTEVMRILRRRLEALAPVPLASVLEREEEQRAEVVKLLRRRKPR